MQQRQPDGGGIKIFGRSYPTIENVEIYGNYASPCGAGVSVEQRGFNQESVVFRNCVFRDNHAEVTGSGVDLLPGSAAVFENSLFVGNLSNKGVDHISPKEGYNKENGSGALTVFPGSRAQVDHCTFTGNWNGVDDKGAGSTYTNSIFWKNNLGGGISPGPRYELDILEASGVSSCFLGGNIDDLRGTIDSSKNVLQAPDPDFDPRYRPRTNDYADAGYRPVKN